MRGVWGGEEGLWGLLQHDLDLSTELSNEEFLKLMKLSETLHGD